MTLTRSIKHKQQMRFSQNVSTLNKLWDRAVNYLNEFQSIDGIWYPGLEQIYDRQCINEDMELIICQSLRLKYDKTSQSYRIEYGLFFDRTDIEDRDYFIEFTPISECPVEVQIDAIPGFMPLKKALIESRQRANLEFESQIQEFELILDEL